MTDDDPFLEHDDNGQLFAPVHRIDLMSLKMLAQDPGYCAIMRIIVGKKKEVKAVREDSTKATAQLVQAQKMAHTYASEAQKALQLSTLPSEESLRQIKSDFTAKLKANQEYNGYLALNITEMTKFANLGVTSATEDVTQLESMITTCEAAIRQLEHRITQYGAWFEKMDDAKKEVEEATDRSRKAERALLTADDMMRIAEGWLGRPNAKLTIEVLEDLLKEPLEEE